MCWFYKAIVPNVFWHQCSDPHVDYRQTRRRKTRRKRMRKRKRRMERKKKKKKRKREKRRRTRNIIKRCFRWQCIITNA